MDAGLKTVGRCFLDIAHSSTQFRIRVTIISLEAGYFSDFKVEWSLAMKQLISFFRNIYQYRIPMEHDSQIEISLENPFFHFWTARGFIIISFKVATVHLDAALPG
jgi:hypothetical protein